MKKKQSFEPGDFLIVSQEHVTSRYREIKPILMKCGNFCLVKEVAPPYGDVIVDDAIAVVTPTTHNLLWSCANETFIRYAPWRDWMKYYRRV